jgi:uncharacterized protein (UPF0276 family)
MTTIGVPVAIHGLSLGANEAVDLDERSFAGTPVGTLASCSRSDSILSP